MTVYFNLEKMDWQDDNRSKIDKLRDYVEQKYPGVPIAIHSTGIIEIDKDLTQAKKDAVKAEIVTALQ